MLGAKRPCYTIRVTVSRWFISEIIMGSFIPSREWELVTWSSAFASQILATPTDFGLVAG